MLLCLQKFDLEVSYRKGIEMHIADPRVGGRAYLSSVRQDGDIKEEVWSVSDTRSLTEIAVEYVNMAEFVPIHQTTPQDVQSKTEWTLN